MIVRTRILPLLLVTVALALTGCDQSAQNIDPANVNRYIISSSSSGHAGSLGNPGLAAPDTVDYFVRAFTIDKDYTWTVNGTEVPMEEDSDQTHVWQQREGEFITVVYSPDDPLTSLDSTGTTTVTITVDAAGDDIDAETIEVPATME